jgi:hypothetical protein
MADKGSKAEKEPLTVDQDSPPALTLEVKTASGEIWGQIIASAKGFYANGKVTNPKTGARYQLGANIILIGSKK